MNGSQLYTQLGQKINVNKHIDIEDGELMQEDGLGQLKWSSVNRRSPTPQSHMLTAELSVSQTELLVTNRLSCFPNEVKWHESECSFSTPERW